jgi:hypothetical protein
VAEIGDLANSGVHWVKAQILEVSSRDYARFDFPIGQREIIRRVLWVSESPDKGFEEHFSSSGQRKRRSCGSGRALGGAFASRLERFFIFLFFYSSA